ncbi:hypothetical protein RA210_U40318 [Rubrivivax sp. A210]|nr:hypothetical protein RA210_U40318 [Rubrivivax sp. A210]
MGAEDPTLGFAAAIAPSPHPPIQGGGTGVSNCFLSPAAAAAGSNLRPWRGRQPGHGRAGRVRAASPGG